MAGVAQLRQASSTAAEREDLVGFSGTCSGPAVGWSPLVCEEKAAPRGNGPLSWTILAERAQSAGSDPPTRFGV